MVLNFVRVIGVIFAFLCSAQASSLIPQKVVDIGIQATQHDYQAGDQFFIVLKYQIKKDWYIKHDKRSHQTFDFRWEYDDGMRIEDLQLPKSSQLFSNTRFQTQGYHDHFSIKVPVYIKSIPKKGKDKFLKLHTKVVVCHNTLGCKLEKQTLTLDFPLHSKQIYHESHPEQTQNYSIFWLVVISFLGGMILNLMPCVLPVLSIKVLSLVNHKHTVHEARIHSIGFVIGVVLTFLALAFGLLLLKSYGYAIGWGFQMQSMIFVYFLACFFLILALNLFGIFEFQMLTIMNWTNSRVNSINHVFLQSLMNGVLSVVVATPCSAPFMGAAIAHALSQTWLEVVLTFTSMGLGLATPVIVLMNTPSLLRYIPKPGDWMVTLKQLFGFAMLLTTLWLVWVLFGLTHNDDIFEILMSLLAMSFAVWLFGKAHHRRVVRYVAYLLMVATVSLTTYALHTKPPLVKWFPYTKHFVDNLREQGQPILIDFTAKWCITCQVNKKLVLEDEGVIDALKKHHVTLIRADWTHHDAHITHALEEYGASSIPLYVFYPQGKGSKAIVLGSVITASKLLEVLPQEN